jgi:hypothetical protein
VAVSAGRSIPLFVVVAALSGALRASSLHICIVLSNRSVPPQSRAPLSSTTTGFGKRCLYGHHVCWEKHIIVCCCCTITLLPRRASSLHTSIVLSNRSFPPQIRAPLSSTSADFDRRCPYGPPCLLEDAHHCLLLLQPQAGAPRALSLHISMVLSNISVTPQRRAPLASLKL